MNALGGTRLVTANVLRGVPHTDHEPGRLALRDRFTHESSCRLDAVRALLGTADTWEQDGDLFLGRIVTEFVKVRLQLHLMWRNKHRSGMPWRSQPLINIFQQPRGLFLVSYRLTRGKGVAHCIFINCNARYVFCNRMGYGSFAGAKKNETALTHRALSKKLRYFKTVNIYAAGALT
jgi:hypothetical protein